jgi:autotransporter passenger strand-loop-strand repeat protein
MTAITIPPDNTKPITLQSGDILTVKQGGTSKNVTINDGAEEDIATGGKAINTTVNDGGRLEASGTIDQTTINGGGVILTHATADHTTINFSNLFPFSQLDARDHSVVKNIVITGGTLLGTTRGVTIDATSTVENVTFRDSSGKGHAGLALDNPQNVTGFVKGLSVGDFIQFGAVPSSNIDVTAFEVTKQNDLIITYNNGLHATYHLRDMQPHTTFQLTQGEEGGVHFSTLTVVAEKTVGNHKVAFESATGDSTDLVSLVGVAHGHGHGHAAADALL